MLHFITHIISFFINTAERENDGYQSDSQHRAQILEHRILNMGKLTDKTRDHFIKALGQPNKVKVLQDGQHCLIWKGSRHEIKVYLDVLDRFDHISESYT